MQITLGQFIDNIEKNGYKQITGQMFGHGSVWAVETEIDIEKYGACALGQGYFNLFHNYNKYNSIWEGLYNISAPVVGKGEYSFPSFIAYENDTLELSISEIVKDARDIFSDSLDKVVYDDGIYLKKYRE